MTTTTTDPAVAAPSSIEPRARLESVLPPAALVVVLLEGVIPPFELGPCGQEQFLYRFLPVADDIASIDGSACGVWLRWHLLKLFVSFWLAMFSSWAWCVAWMQWCRAPEPQDEHGCVVYFSDAVIRIRKVRSLAGVRVLGSEKESHRPAFLVS